MTGQSPAQHVGRQQGDRAELRERLAAVAASIACTEERVAETMERMARVRPADAGRLQARAAQARRFATLERNCAVRFSYPHQPHRFRLP